MTELVATQQLCKSFFEQDHSELKILQDLDFTLAPGEQVAIQGKSGSGKSTLLHILGGLDRPSQGQVSFMGRELADMNHEEACRYRNLELGFVFQSHHLLGDFTAWENVALPCLIAGLSKAQARAKAEALLLQVGLQDRLHHRPGKLSGGERQRVAIARALVNKPKLLLCDEPTGSLDVETGRQVAGLLLQVATEQNTGLIIVTHNPELSSRLQRRMELSQGTLKEMDVELA